MELSKTLLGYAIYLPIAIALTFYVSRILFRNGRIFMLEIFNGEVEMATSTNKLFKTGFYLLNIGFALLILELNLRFDATYQHLVEKLSSKIGGFSIYLGLVLFLNLFLFLRGRKKARSKHIEENIQPA